jgi:hypothetical protein
VDLRGFNRLIERHGWNDRRNALRQHALARAGRPDEQKVN